MKNWFGCTLVVLALTACSDTTNEIGTTIINDFDKLSVSTETFTVKSQSLKIDSVLSQSPLNYLGTVQDPETNTVVSCGFSTQFHTLENFSLPVESKDIVGRDGDKLVADSCILSLIYEDYYGDSLAVMKVTAYEMARPMLENRKYYSNFNPEKENYLRINGLQVNKVYTLVNPLETAAQRAANGYLRSIDFALNEPYTAKDNTTYSNYGSYLLNTYYKNKENFRNTYSFITNVIPGFYFKPTGGKGAMANILLARLSVYYSYNHGGKTHKGVMTFSGTEEVLSTTYVNNDKTQMQALANDKSCTYLKTPSGIFTEVTLPIEEIVKGHEKDSINSAKIAFTRINSTSSQSQLFSVPQTIMMVSKAEMNSFFESKNMVDNRGSFISTFDKSLNQYVFTNISELIKHLYDLKKTGKATEDWNKVVLIPVTPRYNTDASSGTRILSGVFNNMSLTNVKLVGGSENTNAPITISVVYSKFK